MIKNLNNFDVKTDTLFVPGRQHLFVKRNLMTKFNSIEGQLTELRRLAFVAIVTTFS